MCDNTTLFFKNKCLPLFVVFFIEYKNQYDWVKEIVQRPGVYYALQYNTQGSLPGTTWPPEN